MNQVEETLIEYMTFKNGYARMKDLKSIGIHPREIKKAVENGTIDKIKPGLYKLLDFPWDENSSFMDICKSNSKAVICLTSAIEYYGLTTFNPSFITFALPMNVKVNKINYPPIKAYYFRDKVYEMGIKTVASTGGNFQIYSVEKTVVDLFRYRQKIGDDIVLESLKNYLSSRKRDINLLVKYARECGSLKKMTPYLMALTV